MTNIARTVITSKPAMMRKTARAKWRLAGWRLAGRRMRRRPSLSYGLTAPCARLHHDRNLFHVCKPAINEFSLDMRRILPVHAHSGASQWSEKKYYHKRKFIFSTRLRGELPLQRRRKNHKNKVNLATSPRPTMRLEPLRALGHLWNTWGPYERNPAYNAIDLFSSRTQHAKGHARSVPTCPTNPVPWSLHRHVVKPLSTSLT